MRTTVDIDDPILKELKDRGKREGKSLGRLISELLASELQKGDTSGRRSEPPRWISRDMKTRINLEDKDAVYAALDGKGSGDERSGRQ